MSMLTPIRRLSTALSLLCLALAARTFADSPSSAMTVSVTVERSCHVVVGDGQAPLLRCGAEMSGRAEPKIDVDALPAVPAATTGEQPFPQSSLLIINF